MSGRNPLSGTGLTWTVDGFTGGGMRRALPRANAEAVMDANLRLRMVQDLSNRLDDIGAGFDSDEVARTRSLLLTWKSWSCRVLRLLYGAEEAGRFDGALLENIESARSATEWVQHAKRCLSRLDEPGRPFFHADAMRPSRVLVNARARA